MMTFEATSSRDEKCYYMYFQTIYRIRTTKHAELASYLCWLSPLDLLTLLVL